MSPETSCGTQVPHAFRLSHFSSNDDSRPYGNAQRLIRVPDNTFLNFRNTIHKEI